MDFTKEAIDKLFGGRVKRLLAEQFFPEMPRALWQEKLLDSHRWRRYLGGGQDDLG
jgi:hypothetical protein